MDFSGPEPTDFANVTALNRAFLCRLRSPSGGCRLRDAIPESLREAAKGLTDSHVDRLSASPFLLMSLREHDTSFWARVLADEPTFDLFAAPLRDHDDIAIAAVSFMWQLTRQNPYAARLLSGAPPGWCEQLGEQTLLKLLQGVANCTGFLRPRFAGNIVCWRKLLGPGLSSNVTVRESAHLTCLQALLTDRLHSPPRRLRAAACSRPVPVVTTRHSRRAT